MTDNSKPVIEIKLEGQEVKKQSESNTLSIYPQASGDPEQMPGVTLLLNRKKLQAGGGAAVSIETGKTSGPKEDLAPPLNATTHVLTTHSADLNSLGAPLRSTDGQPPVFKGRLLLEALDLKNLKKRLNAHRHSSRMGKLDLMGYFSVRFHEIIYFSVTVPGSLSGVLGWGNAQIVTQANTLILTPQLLPGVFDAMASGDPSIMLLSALRTEERAAFGQLGFTRASFAGVFPVSYKDEITGLWLCASAVSQQISEKELKSLKKLLSDYAV